MIITSLILTISLIIGGFVSSNIIKIENIINIYNMYFNKIGSKYSLAKQIKEKKSLTNYSPASIAMGNISNSVISNNKFYNIENTIMDNYTYNFHIHALYIKTNSSIRKECISKGNEFYKNILGYSYYYDDFLPHALVDKIDSNSVHEMTMLSKNDYITDNEKKY